MSNNNADLTNLGNAFTELTTIGGFLQILFNTALTTLGNAFSELINIGGSLDVSQNALTTLGTAFTDLTTIGGFLGIGINPALGTLGTAFSDLISIGGFMLIENNADLTTLGNAFTRADGVQVHGQSAAGAAIFISGNAATTTANFDPTKVCYTTTGASAEWDLVDPGGVQYPIQPSECP
jgi:hypothetical protein